MAILVKQSTACTIPLGPFVDSTDGVTAKTGLTISQADIRLSKNGAAFAQTNNAAGATHMENGNYSIPLNTTDTNTLGHLRVHVNESGALPVWLDLMVVPAVVYDSIVGGTDTLTVDVVQIGGSAVSTSSAQIGVNVVNAGGTAWASGSLTSGVFAAGAINAAAIADAAIDRATFAADTGLQAVRSSTAQAGASTSVTLDASASSTTDFYKHCLVYLTGGTGVGQFRIITAYNGTTKVATVTPAWATNPDNTSTFAVLPCGIANLEAIAGSAVSTSTAQLGVNVVNAAGTAWGSGAITAASIAADAITAAKLASDVATEINAAVLAVLGALNDAAADGAVTTTDTMVAYLKQIINTLEGAPGIVTYPSSATPGNGVSLAEVIRQIYDEVAGLNGGALLDAAGVRSAVGLASANLDTQLTTIDDLIDTEIGTIITRLGTPSDLGGGATVAANLADIEAQTDDIGAAGAGLTAADDAILAAIAALNNISAAQVNAEVVDALATDTYAEPGQAAPSATTTLAAKINYLYKAWRNKKTQTSSQYSLFADDASTVDQKATVSDDGTTTTVGEVASGP